MVNICTTIRLRNARSGIRLPARVWHFFLLRNFQASSWDEQAFSSMGNRAVFSGVKWPGRDVDHLPPFIAEVKYEWSYTLLPLWAFIAQKRTTSPVPDIINSSFFSYAEFLSSKTVTVYINTTKNLVFTVYWILTLAYDIWTPLSYSLKRRYTMFSMG